VDTDRPDPEALLARVKEEEARKRRGKLKVFFGAAAGVGKTYAMLEAAREQRADGIDVLVGYVETHGRPETDALLEGLEILPLRSVEYRGTALREFDRVLGGGLVPGAVVLHREHCRRHIWRRQRIDSVRQRLLPHSDLALQPEQGRILDDPGAGRRDIVALFVGRVGPRYGEEFTTTCGLFVCLAIRRLMMRR